MSEGYSDAEVRGTHLDFVPVGARRVAASRGGYGGLLAKGHWETGNAGGVVASRAGPYERGRRWPVPKPWQLAPTTPLSAESYIDCGGGARGLERMKEEGGRMKREHGLANFDLRFAIGLQSAGCWRPGGDNRGHFVGCAGNGVRSPSVGAKSLPARAGIFPVEEGILPAKSSGLLAMGRSLPAKTRGLPAKRPSLLARARILPVGSNGLPVESGILPVETKPLHVGTTALHVDPLALLVGARNLHVAARSLHVGTTSLHVERTPLHVGRPALHLPGMRQHGNL
jgi:hypothetical protein